MEPTLTSSLSAEYKPSASKMLITSKKSDRTALGAHELLKTLVRPYCLAAEITSVGSSVASHRSSKLSTRVWRVRSGHLIPKTISQPGTRRDCLPCWMQGTHHRPHGLELRARSRCIRNRQRRARRATFSSSNFSHASGVIFLLYAAMVCKSSWRAMPNRSSRDIRVCCGNVFFHSVSLSRISCVTAWLSLWT